MQSFDNSSLTRNDTIYYDVDVMPVGLHWFLNSLMVLTTLCGLGGNGLVCYFFYKRKVKFTSFNMLLLNLSIADMLGDIFAYPHIFVDLKVLRNVSQSHANMLCAVTIGITPFGIVTGVTILTIAYIAVNRLVSVRFPFKTAFFKSRKYTSWVLLIIWLWGIAYVIPNGFAFRYDYQYAVCYRQWPKDINGTVWSMVGLIIGFIGPIVIMFASFFATLHKFKLINASGSADQRETMEKKKRAVKLLGYLIMAYFICWGPSTIYLMFSLMFPKVWPEGVEGQYARMRAIRATFLITLTNTVLDPIIYGYHNLEFQKCFKEVFNKVLKPNHSLATDSTAVGRGNSSEQAGKQMESNRV